VNDHVIESFYHRTGFCNKQLISLAIYLRQFLYDIEYYPSITKIQNVEIKKAASNLIKTAL
jgi:hypothetical protein